MKLIGEVVNNCNSTSGFNARSLSNDHVTEEGANGDPKFSSSWDSRVSLPYR